MAAQSAQPSPMTGPPGPQSEPVETPEVAPVGRLGMFATYAIVVFSLIAARVAYCRQAWRPE